jgi:multicomponent Na+:H+ antiporter subunit D
MRFSATGSLAFGPIGLDGGPASLLIFIGFGVNAAWPGLHAWLTDAYPASSATGAVFLSAFTTKSAVYVLARAFPGTEALIWIGAAMAVFPLFYAVIENDLRRTLSYMLINQVGFMMVGIGIGSELALNGACAHAFAHLLYDGLVFMALGAVMHRTGRTRATELGGLFGSMPVTAVCCIVGGLSFAAFPLTSGFVSKSLVLSAAGEEGLALPWLMLMAASAGAFLLAGVKIPYYAFFGSRQGEEVREAPPHMLLAMILAAGLSIGIGVWPRPLYDLLPFAVDYEPYTAPHVLSQLQLVCFSGLAFALMLLGGLYPAMIRSVNLDVDVFYRFGARWLAKAADKTLNGLNAGFNQIFVIDLAGWAQRTFANAPERFFCALTCGQSRERVQRCFAAGAAPIGISIAAATLALLAFILFGLAQ